jgi:hypothetical protein
MNTFASRTLNATKGIVIALATLSIWPVAASAQLKVIISGGFAGAYEQLLPEFERTSGIKSRPDRVRRRDRGRRRSARNSPAARLLTW